MKIVELGHAGETALEHFGEGQGGDGLDLFGPAPIKEAVHQVTPGPEIIIAVLALGSTRLGQTGHGALEGMAVDIDDARQGHAVSFVCGSAGYAGLEA